MILETYLAADIELYNYFKQKFDQCDSDDNLC